MSTQVRGLGSNAVGGAFRSDPQIASRTRIRAIRQAADYPEFRINHLELRPETTWAPHAAQIRGARRPRRTDRVSLNCPTATRHPGRPEPIDEYSWRPGPGDGPTRHPSSPQISTVLAANKYRSRGEGADWWVPRQAAAEPAPPPASPQAPWSAWQPRLGTQVTQVEPEALPVRVGKPVDGVGLQS